MEMFKNENNMEKIKYLINKIISKIFKRNIKLGYEEEWWEKEETSSDGYDFEEKRRIFEQDKRLLKDIIKREIEKIDKIVENISKQIKGKGHNKGRGKGHEKGKRHNK